MPAGKEVAKWAREETRFSAAAHHHNISEFLGADLRAFSTFTHGTFSFAKLDLKRLAYLAEHGISSDLRSPAVTRKPDAGVSPVVQSGSPTAAPAAPTPLVVQMKEAAYRVYPPAASKADCVKSHLARWLLEKSPLDGQLRAKMLQAQAGTRRQPPIVIRCVCSSLIHCVVRGSSCLSLVSRVLCTANCHELGKLLWGPCHASRLQVQPPTDAHHCHSSR